MSVLQCVSVPRKYALFQQGVYDLPHYYSIILILFRIFMALHLFVICSLPTPKCKSLFLVSCIWETGNVRYDALLFLSIKACLIRRYSQQSNESVGISVSYFNYLLT